MQNTNDYAELGDAERQPYVEPVMLIAPFPGMDKPWSDAKIKEFEEVLSRYETD